MSSDAIEQRAETTTPVVVGQVTLSPWINERFPGWHQLLSAHEVARLTRRPRWLLSGMALVGRFPKKHCFRGRKIGWLRAEVIDWLASVSPRSQCLALLDRPHSPGATDAMRARCSRAQAQLNPGKPLTASLGAARQRRLALKIPCRSSSVRREFTITNKNLMPGTYAVVRRPASKSKRGG